MSTALIHDAAIVEIKGKRWWRCPNCGKTLGELVGNRVVIKVGGRQLSLRQDAEPDQSCWGCGLTSMIRKEPVCGR